MVHSANCVRWLVVIGVLMVLSLSQVDVCAAKSLGLQDGYWSSEGSATKRNSWWSKKSLESTPNFQQMLKDSRQEDLGVDVPDSLEVDYGRDTISTLYGCYITSCVPEFVRCAQRSRSHGNALLAPPPAPPRSFSQCRRDHQLCALQCRFSSAEKTYVV